MKNHETNEKNQIQELSMAEMLSATGGANPSMSSRFIDSKQVVLVNGNLPVTAHLQSDQ